MLLFIFLTVQLYSSVMWC